MFLGMEITLLRYNRIFYHMTMNIKHVNHFLIVQDCYFDIFTLDKLKSY